MGKGRILLLILIALVAALVLAGRQSLPISSEVRRAKNHGGADPDALRFYRSTRAASRGAITANPEELPPLSDRPFNAADWKQNSIFPLSSSPTPTGDEIAMLATVVAELGAPTPTATPEATKTNSHPMLETLRELEREPRPPDNSNLLGGVVRHLTPAVSNQASGIAPAISESGATPTPEALAAVGGQARGYHMLYLMHPNARATVEKQLETLLRSGVRDLYLGVLTDGTFGKDIPYLISAVQRLAAGQRSLTLALYLTNGPGMRTYSSSPTEGGFNSIDPIRFRDLIQHDDAVRSRFRAMVAEVKPALEASRRSNSQNRNLVFPMLEDNLDHDAYAAMRALIEDEVGTLAQVARNPCLGCVDGNDSAADGDPIEEHAPEEIASLNPRDGFSLDGIGYSFSTEFDSQQPDPDTIRNLIDLSLSRRLSYFALWRAERQGRDPTGPPLPPDQRIYEVPTAAQAEEEVALLRYGLK
ncbi:MAG: hypothetical protein K1X83_11710 [Oligoflexia bacterium]|nr:hypothetical protein [Oligoflexia bacterium]